MGVFAFSRGCVCSGATTQALCLQHAHRATPLAGGTMELVEDLTEGGGFARYWEARP